MTRTKKIIAALFVVLGVMGVYGVASAKPELPVLKDGDLIYHTSTSRQSNAIFMATRHPYTHMGMIKNTKNGPVVIEAAGRVRETPLQNWIDRGLMGRVAVYRLDNITPEQTRIINASAKNFYGKPYDIFFSFDNDALYCSELPYLAYQKAGISIGKVEKVGDLNLGNAVVKALIEQRWQRHPICKARQFTFEQCYEHVAQQELITPASIARDPQFTQIYSNYPF